MKKIKKQITSFLILLAILSIKFFIISSFSVVLAQTSQNTYLEQSEFSDVGQIAYGESGTPSDIRIIVVKIINVVLGLLATIFLLLVVIAGYKWMTSGGNQEKTKEASGQIRSALIGLIIITISWSISFFILRRLVAISQGHLYYADPVLPAF
jgi:hypothetical protein